MRWLAVLFAVIAAGTGCRFSEGTPRASSVVVVPDLATSQILAAAESPPPAKPQMGTGPLTVPDELPGSQAPPFVLPRTAGMTPAERTAAIQGKYPTLPTLEPLPAPAPSATGKPLTLAELEQTALANNPLIKQAAADVEAARGQMIQAGLWPNPEAGYQADQIGSGRGVQTRGQQGGYVAWVLKTAGKLRLARLVEAMNYVNAQVALRRAEVDLTSRVRNGYFATLVAHQTVVVNRALAQFSEDIYRAQLKLVQGGEQAAYEPLQSYVLAIQARGNLVQARNRYVAAWKQLAAALGQPDLPPTELAGRADTPVPEYAFDPLKEMMLANHTDVLTAQNSIHQARHRVQLAEASAIPDLKTSVYIEKDWSTPPFNTQVGVQAGGAIPIFDRNQGGRLAAQAQLSRAIQDVARAQNDLSGKLAQAWEAYANNKTLAAFYRDHAIPNQVRVYRGTYQRFQQEPGKVNYNDVVIAQQTLATVLNSYLTYLAAQWTAVVDLAALTQQPELYLDSPDAAPNCLDGLLKPEVPAPAPTVPKPLPEAPKPPTTLPETLSPNAVPATPFALPSGLPVPETVR